MSFLLPISWNPSFTPSTMDATFTKWRDLGLNEATPAGLDYILGLGGGVSHLISLLYNSLLPMNLPSTESLKLQWEQELGEEICSEFWTDALENIHTCSVNSRHCLIQFKIIHRLHYTKTKLHRLFPDVSPFCDKCQTDVATPLHSYILCSQFISFWTEVFKTLSGILHSVLELKPLLVIFGISDKIMSLKKSQQQLLSCGLKVLHLEKKRFLLVNRLDNFDKIWSPLLLYLDNAGWVIMRCWPHHYCGMI